MVSRNGYIVEGEYSLGIPVHQTAPRKFPAVTLFIILINIVVFILMYIEPQLLVPGATNVYEVQRQLAMIPIAIVRGERLWTIFTAMFTHADIYHLLGNMIFLFFFGGPVESVMGRKRYLLFYFLGGIMADIFHILSITIIPSQYLITGKIIINPWVTPTLGASGAISAVMGAYLIYYPRSRITMVYPIWIIPLIFTLPAWVYILIWFFYQLVMGLITLLGFASSIAFWAHIGGFISGIAFAPFFMEPAIKEQIRMYKAMLREYMVEETPYYEEEFY